MKKALVIRLSAMGDVAMTVPVLNSFLKLDTEVKLSVLSRKDFAPFFRTIGVNFIGINLKDYSGLKGLYRLFKILKKEQFELVLDLHDVLRSNVLRIFFRLAGIKVVVIDKGRKDKRAMTRRENKILRPLRSTCERYTDVFRQAGFDVKPDFRSIYNNDSDISDKVEAVLAKSEEIKIGVAPFAAHLGKTYPLKRMEEVVKYLSEKGFSLFLFGSVAEKSVLEEWQSKYPHCLSIAGKLTLTEELQLISKLDLMLSMDSANMHLASLVNVPVISIWGATHPYAGFSGWGQSPENMIQADVPCRPCSVYGNKKCYRKDKPYACMNEISPGIIVDKIISTLGRKDTSMETS
jgi:ADP-heptose:LPS heptosyltransferase